MNYLDTSVLTSYYCPEPLSVKVQRLLSRIPDPMISPLVEVELHCAVARKVRAGELDDPAGRRIFAQFRLHLAQQSFQVVSISAGEYSLARQWVETLATPLRTLDALHLATAFANGLTLVTADKDLSSCAGHFGVQTRLVS